MGQRAQGDCRAVSPPAVGWLSGSETLMLIVVQRRPPHTNPKSRRCVCHEMATCEVYRQQMGCCISVPVRTLMAAIVVEAAHSDGPHLKSITGGAVPGSSNPTHGLTPNSPTSVVASTRISDGRMLSPPLIEQASHLGNHHGQRCGLWRGGGGVPFLSCSTDGSISQG